MSDAGLPGLGLRLGAEILRGPNGVWYSATGADGIPVGVLRFDRRPLAAPGAVERLVDRVVAARAGMLGAEVLPIIDLVEDAGWIWLITRTLPVAATADRTERALLTAQQGASAGVAASASVGVVAQGPWRPEIDLGEPGGRVPPSQAPSWGENTVGERPRRGRGPWLIAGLIALLAAGAGVGTALYLTKDTTSATSTSGTSAAAIAVTSFAVKSDGVVTVNGVNQSPPKAVTTTDICTSVVRVVGMLQTNRGQGTIQYRWDIPNAKPILKSVVVGGSDPSPYALVLDWTLNLHGSGTVTAKLTLLSPTSASAVPESVSLPYVC